jgi:prophage DNA circulation protein
MTWSDDLRRVTFPDRKMPDGRTIPGVTLIGASFRGVPFLVESADRAGGRRTVVHQFPFRDEPYVEDLGETAHTHRVEGYVIGDNYLSQKNDLLNELEKFGPGTLVHPYYGSLTVICSSVSVHESRADGGYAQFSLEFSETPAQSPSPSAVSDPVAQVSAAADAANAATDAQFATDYDGSGLPAFALASAETAIKNAAAAIKDQLSSVVSATQEAAQLNSQVTLITAEAASLARTPALILGRFRDALHALSSSTIAAPGAVMSALFDTYVADLGATITGTSTTATRTRESSNQVALTSALRRVFVIEAARLAPIVPFVSTDDAITARTKIAGFLDEQAALADNLSYPAIVDLRSQVLRAVPGGAAFASIVTVTRKVPVPSLLLAYQLYGSVTLEADLLARNAIRHPGFVAGDLKALSNG